LHHQLHCGTAWRPLGSSRGEWPNRAVC
jgi:hypothetical protein